MYVNHYAKRVANNKPWKKNPPKRFFTQKLFRVLHKNLHVSSLVKDVGKIRKLMVWQK